MSWIKKFFKQKNTFYLIFIAIMFYTILSSFMNYIYPKPLVLSSPIDGILINSDGSPVSNVKIERTWNWAWWNKSGSDSTVTDAYWQFTFEKIVGRSITARIFPHEPSISIRLYAYVTDAETKTILSLNKASYREWSENNMLSTWQWWHGVFYIKCYADKDKLDDSIYNSTCKLRDR